jgi:hypothetical protein
MEAAREMSEPRTINDDATSTTPRIVNGLPVRRREKVNVWSVLGIFLGSFFVPDIVLLLAMVPLGVRRILKYLDARGKLDGRPDVLK